MIVHDTSVTEDGDRNIDKEVAAIPPLPGVGRRLLAAMWMNTLHYFQGYSGAYYGGGMGSMASPFAWFDWTLLLLIPAFIVSAIAQARISSTYRKYSQIPDRSGTTGAQFAAQMLRSNNVTGITIQPVAGELTDHFDPRTDTVNLSQDVYAGHSVASVAIAAHECGHVLQDVTDYAPMRMRAAIVPVANLCSNISMPLILIGIIFSAFSFLVSIGAWMFFAVVVFQLVTLPVEFNASSRAMKNIAASGVLTADEEQGARKVLSAAAMTYVAATLSAFLSFLRLLIIANNRRR